MTVAVMDERKRKRIDIELIVLSVLILLGVGSTGYLFSMDKSVITVSVKPNETQTICFEELCLRPGESCEYTVLIGSESAEACQLTLCFTDQAPALTLKDHAYIRVERGDDVLCDARLSEIFAQETITVPVDFSNGAKNAFKITYYMPESVGNDAQNAEARFQLLVTAESD